MFMNSRTGWARTELEGLENEGRLIPIRTLEGPQGAWVTIEGKKVLNMCSNNYLGLANHPEVRKAAQRAIDEFGMGAGAVRSIAGTNSLHAKLEAVLAEFKHFDSSLVYQGGLLANLGSIPVLVGKEDVIFSEELNHASIIDGVRLSSARRVVYRHLDMDDLRRQLSEHRKEGRKALIITDGVFSMDGDIAPLPDIAKLGEEFDAMVYVDDAHGEGVLGDHGRGIVDHFHLTGKVDMEMGTFSKALGGMGGFVASDSGIIALMKQRSRPFLFSSALNPGDAASILRSLEIMKSDDSYLKKLWENARKLKEGLVESGYNLGDSKTPITPVMIGSEKLTLDLSRALYQENNVFASPIVFPTVARGSARIRLMPSAVHSDEDISYAVESFRKQGAKLGIIK
ncbi:MAG: glycine C-acetyltransferase [Candidatus Thermoplasmatota archaeon]|nr:glycine C-acetyltransferase [Candidatus Thermoplasmatota archaeon]